METITQIAVVIIALYILVEVATAVYIYRNRATVIPRLRAGLRNLLGLDNDASVGDAYNRVRNAEYQDLNKKITYIGRHTKFERDQLRKMGILKALPTPPKQDDNVIPLKRN